MDHGVVVLDGEKPPDGTPVDVTPLNIIPAVVLCEPIASHPALGIWKDRSDLPDNSVKASRALRERLMRRDDDSVN